MRVALESSRVWGCCCSCFYGSYTLLLQNVLLLIVCLGGGDVSDSKCKCLPFFLQARLISRVLSFDASKRLVGQAALTHTPSFLFCLSCCCSSFGHGRASNSYFIDIEDSYSPPPRVLLARSCWPLASICLGRRALGPALKHDFGSSATSQLKSTPSEAEAGNEERQNER